MKKIRCGDIVTVSRDYLVDILGTTIMFKKNKNGNIIATYIGDNKIEVNINHCPNTMILTGIDVNCLKKVNSKREPYKKEWQSDKMLLKRIFHTDLPFKKVRYLSDKGINDRAFLLCNKVYVFILNSNHKDDYKAFDAHYSKIPYDYSPIDQLTIFISGAKLILNKRMWIKNDIVVIDDEDTKERYFIKLAPISKNVSISYK